MCLPFYNLDSWISTFLPVADRFGLARYAKHNGLCSLDIFETVKPGEILDISLGKSFLFFCWPRSFVRCSDVRKWSHYIFRAVR